MKKVIACIVTTAFLFGTMEIALKIGGNTFDPLQLTGLRFLIGGLVLLPMAMKEYKENFTDTISVETANRLFKKLLGL